jgi:hypothetical protein
MISGSVVVVGNGANVLGPPKDCNKLIEVLVTTVVGTVVGTVVAIATVVTVGVASTVKRVVAELEKLYEFPVHVPPVGLSRPYAYILKSPLVAGAVRVTLKVAVRRSPESDGPP